jgi:hypothetical protein
VLVVEDDPDHLKNRPGQPVAVELEQDRDLAKLVAPELPVYAATPAVARQRLDEPGGDPILDQAGGHSGCVRIGRIAHQRNELRKR